MSYEVWGCCDLKIKSVSRKEATYFLDAPLNMGMPSPLIFSRMRRYFGLVEDTFSR